MSRKKKLKFIQLSLLTLSILMIFFAYFNKFSPEEKNIISKQEQQNIENKISNESDQDIFFKISYSGLDFSGNRYIINAEEARNDKDVVMVPKGYHPVATIAGYDNYYLNVMAGPVRKWCFTWEDDHDWINGETYS